MWPLSALPFKFGFAESGTQMYLKRGGGRGGKRKNKLAERGLRNRRKEIILEEIKVFLLGGVWEKYNSAISDAIFSKTTVT